jgi:hypothetical protein
MGSVFEHGMKVGCDRRREPQPKQVLDISHQATPIDLCTAP